MKIRLLIFSGVFALLAASAVHAQTLSVEVPFAFSASGDKYPAGHYKLSPATGDRSIRIDGPENHRGFAVVITRLAAAIHTTPKDAHVVFDKVGEQYFLSEIWFPDQDGYDMHNTKVKHEHQVIDVPIK